MSEYDLATFRLLLLILIAVVVFIYNKEKEVKITRSDFNELKGYIEAEDTPERRAQYLKGEFPNANKVISLDERYRWDLLFFGIRFTLQKRMDSYLHDGHIDTALKRIVPPLS